MAKAPNKFHWDDEGLEHLVIEKAADIAVNDATKKNLPELVDPNTGRVKAKDKVTK